MNYHYFIRGGPDRYFFNVMQLLTQAGHTVIPFAFDYVETLPTPFRRYFPQPITGPGPCTLDQQHLTLTAKLKTVPRMFSNPQVNRKFRRIIEEQSPDLIYSIYSSFTFLPNIFRIARQEFSLPVVYRLSDFHMFCPSYLFFRDDAVCTECRQNLLSAVKYKCVHQSRLMSLLRVLQINHARLRKSYDYVNAFICPSKFMQQQLLAADLPPDKVIHLPTFTPDLGPSQPDTDQPCILFLGKVIPAKGAHILLQAFNLIPSPQYKLRLIGPVLPEYRRHLLSLLDPEHLSLVSIDGPQPAEQVNNALQKCMFLVAPALWYENMPNSVLEALSAGKPVIASDLGSLPELVQHGRSGLLIPPGDAPALAQAMQELSNSSDLQQLSQAARATYSAEHTPQQHLVGLMTIFESLLTP